MSTEQYLHFCGLMSVNLSFSYLSHLGMTLELTCRPTAFLD